MNLGTDAHLVEKRFDIVCVAGPSDSPVLAKGL
jgi:hypothetical protein